MYFEKNNCPGNVSVLSWEMLDSYLKPDNGVLQGRVLNLCLEGNYTQKIMFKNLKDISNPICIIKKTFTLSAAVYDTPEYETALATFFLLHPLHLFEVS